MRPLTDNDDRELHDVYQRDTIPCAEMPTLVPDAPDSRPPSDWTGFPDEMRRILDDAGEL